MNIWEIQFWCIFQYAKNMAELDQIVADVSQYFDLEQSKSKPRKTLAFKHIDSILLSLGRKVRTVNICLVLCNLNFAWKKSNKIVFTFWITNWKISSKCISKLIPIFFKDDNEENKDPVPRNFIVNRDPYPDTSPLPDHAKAPPPPPPIRTRPSMTVNSRLKPSDSSFGLHSPDTIPLGLDDKAQVHLI